MQMTSRVAGNRTFVLRRLIAELMPAHKTGVEKELHRGIDRGTAHMIPFKLHGFAQHIHIKVVAGRKKLFQAGQIAREYAADHDL